MGEEIHSVDAVDLAKGAPLAGTGRKLKTVVFAARELFLDQGFSATSMDAIAAAAGVSKATLYAYFSSKEALFAYLVKAQCEIMELALPLPDLSEGLLPALRNFARQYVQVFVESRDVAFIRTIANESGRFPDLCRLVYESGPLATIRRLARFLDEAKAHGLLEFPDSMIAATQFLSLVRGELPLRTVLGIEDVDKASIDREIEAGVDLFVRACRPAAVARTGDGGAR